MAEAYIIDAVRTPARHRQAGQGRAGRRTSAKHLAATRDEGRSMDGATISTLKATVDDVIWFGVDTGTGMQAGDLGAHGGAGCGAMTSPSSGTYARPVFLRRRDHPSVALAAAQVNDAGMGRLRCCGRQPR